MNATSRIFLKAGVWVAVGIIAINTLLTWYYTGFTFSFDILIVAIPVVVFAWVTTLLCEMFMRHTGYRYHVAVISASVLVGLHVMALVYFLFALWNWREGAEFAEIFIIHEIFVIAVLCFGVLRPVVKSRSRSGTG